MQFNSRLGASLLILLPMVIAAPAKRQNSATNSLLSLVTELYPVNVLVKDITDLITEADVAFGEAAGYQTTENDVVQGKCADIVLIFARGTTEAGNVGSLVGPPFFDAVKEQLNGRTLAIQGVNDYPATVSEYLSGGSPSGSANMAQMVQKSRAGCPGAHIVMSGYSQGGQLVHNAAKLLGNEDMKSVSTVIFGDPFSHYEVQGTSKASALSICHQGDDICDDGDFILLPHLTYLEDADQAATFVSQRAR